MQSNVWRLQGIDTTGGYLTLSRIIPWSGGPQAALSITCSFTPSEGAVENLLLDDASTCTWSADVVRAPGFYIEVTISAPATPWGFKFAGPSPNLWISAHQIAIEGSCCNLNAPRWIEGGLSPVSDSALLFGKNYGEWNQLSSAGNKNWYKVYTSENGERVLASASGYPYLLLSIDGGQSWVDQVAASSRTWEGCAISEDGNVLIGAAYGNYIYISHDVGLTWEVQTDLGVNQWNSVASSADGAVICACAYRGYLHISRNYGLNWEPVAALGSWNWRDCRISSDGMVICAVSQSGYIFLSQDAGVNWQRLDALGNREWYACDVSSDGQTLVACVWSGFTYISRDGGATWSAISTLGSASWHGVGISADGSVIFVSKYNDGYLYLSTDGGLTWSTKNSTARAWTYCSVSDNGKALYAGVYNSGPLFKYAIAPGAYLDRPVKQTNSQPILALSSDSPFAQEQSPMRRLRMGNLDMEFGGESCIYGTVELYSQAGNIPLPRRVRLHRSRDGLLVRETWSDAQGNYRFDGITERYKYDVIAWDHEGLQQSVVANDLTPEIMQ